MRFLFLLSIFLFSSVQSDEIIMDMDGNYILMRDDGTFKKLSTPKTGNKYILKKKIKKNKKKFRIFKKQEKKARTRSNSGIR